ncbi:hypothetical protein LOC51_08660 [Rubrivivax sp. JA1024]|nr:hypothetical protein [Rubrivivax sp. JA1024]
MAPNRDQVKNRIKNREQDDPELDYTLQTGRELAEQETKNKKNELERSDKVNGHLHRALVISIYVFGTAICCLFLVLCWHYGASTDWRFLSPEQQSKLESFLFSGTVGGLLAGFGKTIVK